MNFPKYLLPVFAMTSTVNAGFFGKNIHTQNVLSSSSNLDVTGGHVTSSLPIPEDKAINFNDIKKIVDLKNPNEFSIKQLVDKLNQCKDSLSLSFDLNEVYITFALNELYDNDSDDDTSIHSKNGAEFNRKISQDFLDSIRQNNLPYLKLLIDHGLKIDDTSITKLLDLFSQKGLITNYQPLNINIPVDQYNRIHSFNIPRIQKQIFSWLPFNVFIYTWL